MKQTLMAATNTVTTESKARYLSLQRNQFRDKHGVLREGDDLNDNGDIIRYSNGLIHSDDEPAIECSDGHVEFWYNGMLHNNNGLPAVISEGGRHQEYWNMGNRVG